MKIDNEFTVSAPIERAWEILNDIPLIAPCMPGAVLTGSEGDTHEGKVKIKVGPVTSEYKGKATFLEKDEAARRLVIKGEGRDTRGAGNANADITLQMTAEGDNTRINVDTDLKITGKVAQFGRGVIVDISQKLLGQFVDCLEAKIATVEDDAAKIAGAGAEEAAATTAATGTMGIGKQPSGDVESSPEDHATQCWPAGSPGATEGAAAEATDVAARASGRVAEAASGATAAAGAAGAAAVAGAAGVAGAAAGGIKGAAGKLTGGSDASTVEEPEALDLMDIAGGAVYKRLIPVAVVAAIVIAIILWLVLG